MKTFRFFDFPVYNEAKDLYLVVIKFTEQLRIFSLKDQIERAALSIVLNIAEGSAKSSDKEFARFLQISLGSVNEVVACIDVLYQRKYITKADAQRLFLQCELVAKQLGGFTKKLRS